MTNVKAQIPNQIQISKLKELFDICHLTLIWHWDFDI